MGKNQPTGAAPLPPTRLGASDRPTTARPAVLHRAGSSGRFRLFGLFVAAIVASLGVLAYGSVAHATPEDTIALTSSDPRDGVVLSAPPAEIILNFDREIPLGVEDTASLSCGGQLMFIGDGQTENNRTSVRYEITSAVPRGLCVLDWGLAESGGPAIVQGNVSFTVETATVTAPPATEAPAETAVSTPASTATPGSEPASQVGTQISVPSAPTAVTEEGAGQEATGFDATLWFSRLLSTTGILVLFGALVVIGTGWPEGPEYFITSRFFKIVWGISLLATVVYIVAYAAQVRGDSLAGGLNPLAWLELRQQGWPGIGAILRLVTVGASGYVALQPERLDDPNSGLWAWAFPAIAVATIALSRVSGPAAPVGVIIGILHAFGSAIWLGGAVFVGRIVLAGPGEEDLVVATRTYSRSSLAAILITVVTGVFQTVRLDSTDLFGSHGRVVLFKVLAVGVMLFIGLEARKQVRFRLDREYEMSPNNAARFRRAYGTETVFGIVALALSSFLVSISPGTELPWAGENYVEELTLIDPNSGVDAVFHIGPLNVGRNGYLIQVRQPPVGISELKLSFIPPAGTQNGQAWIIEDVIPLRGRGSVWRPTSVGIPLQVPGTWTLRMESTTQQDSQSAVEQTFVVTLPGASAPTSAATSTTITPAQVEVVPQSTTVPPVASNP